MGILVGALEEHTSGNGPDKIATDLVSNVPMYPHLSSTMLTEYELRQQLDPAHSDDVKAVLAISDDCIASGSRDGIVGIWKLAESGPVGLQPQS